MSEVIDLDDHRKDPLYSILAMCVQCKHRWIGGVPIQTSLFQLECPQCHVQDSFASFIPQEYSDHLTEWAEGREPYQGD